MPSVSKTTTYGGTAGRKTRRKEHIVDRAYACAQAICDGSPGQDEEARRRRRYREQHGLTRGAVSILERFGRLLLPLAPEELAVFRTPTVTFKRIQLLLREGVPTETLMAQLHELATGIRLDGRSQRHTRKRSSDDAPPIPLGYHFDHELAEADPVGYISSMYDGWFRAIVLPYWWLVLRQITGTSREPLTLPPGDMSVEDFRDAIMAIRDRERQRVPVNMVSDELVLAERVIRDFRAIHAILGGFDGWDRLKMTIERE